MTTWRQVGQFLIALLGAAAVAGASPGGLRAQERVPQQVPAASALAEKYADCMSLARTSPEKAVAIATQWERDGGEDGARHCAAVALLNSGQYEEAARRLESLSATTRRSGKALKAELLAQAGQAWLIAGKATEALSAQTRALKLAGPRTELLIDRAITRASIGEYWEAIDDLNAAIDKAPERADALVYRATAWRKLKNIDLAYDDAARAVEIAPANTDALLERGNIRLLRNDRAGAEADWLAVIAVDANSPAAAAARENLAKLKKPN